MKNWIVLVVGFVGIIFILKPCSGTFDPRMPPIMLSSLNIANKLFDAEYYVGLLQSEILENIFPTPRPQGPILISSTLFALYRSCFLIMASMPFLPFYLNKRLLMSGELGPILRAKLNNLI